MKKTIKINNQIQKIILIFCICVLLSQSIVIAKPNNENNTIKFKYIFNEPTLKKVELNGYKYTEILMPGSLSIGKSGLPSLPAVPFKLCLPPGTILSSIKIKTGKPIIIESEKKGFDLKINPIFPIQSDISINEKVKEFEYNKEVYAKNNLLPVEIFDEPTVGYSHGFPIITGHLNIIQYNPVKGTLTYIPKVTIEIEYKQKEVNRFYRGTKDDINYVSSLVDNKEVPIKYGEIIPDPKLEYEGGLCDPTDNNEQGYDYVIITREILANFTGTEYNWDDFIERKQTQGLETTIVTVEDILDCTDYWNQNPLFDDEPARIREFCRDAYEDWGTSYILIAGDNDNFHPETKIQRRLLHYGLQNAEDTDSDLYWSNLDNTFNDDADNEWGEEGDTGFDMYSEIFIGSIPCDEPIDISNWISKSFIYADSNDYEYLSGAAFYAGDTRWECEGDDYLEYSALSGTDSWNGPDPDNRGPYPSWFGFQHGFETFNDNYPYLAFDISQKWTSEPPNNGWIGLEEDYEVNEARRFATHGLREIINNNQVSLISAVAHAMNRVSMEVIYRDWENECHNTKPFFVHDYGCHCGDMDAIDDGVLDSMLFHSNVSLAFACVYNTCTGWGNGYSTNSSSAVQQKLFWDYFFDIENNSGSFDNWQLGKAQAWSKDFMAPTIDWIYDDNRPGTWRAVIEGCLLFGDPAQNIKTVVNPNMVTNISSIGLDGITINSVVATENHVYVGTVDYGVYKKDILNIDSEWECLGLPFRDIRSIYVDPAFPQIIYAGISVFEEIDEHGFPHSLYRSYDGGITWEPCDIGIDDINWDGNIIRLPVLCIKGVPGNPLILYATSADHLFKSTDGGNSWIRIRGQSGIYGWMKTLTIDPSNSYNIWVAGESNMFSGYISKSTDGGETWMGVTPDNLNGDNSCYSIAINPHNSNIVYAGMEGRVYKSMNGGNSWQLLLDDLAYFRGLIIDPLNTNHLYMGGDTNGGNDFKIWEYFDPGPQFLAPWYLHIDENEGKILSMVFDRNNFDIIYAGTTNGVYKFESNWDGRGDLPSNPNYH